ncbi:MAG: hypothetical protein WD717_03540, partial [Nitrosarchaeum sp.]
TDAVSANISTTISLTENLGLTDAVSAVSAKTISLTENLGIKDQLQFIYKKAGATSSNLIVPSGTTTVTAPENNVNILLTNSSNIETIVINQSTNNTAINYTSSLVSGYKVTITNGFNVTAFVLEDNSVVIPIVVTIPDGITFTGPTGWSGILNLPTITSVTIPQTTTTTNGVTTTTTYSEVAVFELGFSGSTIQLSSPVRIKFTGNGENDNVAFYVGPSGATTFITTQCTSDSSSGMPSGADECYFDNGDDLIIWTDHFTKFGASQRSTSTSSSGSSSAGSSAGTSGGAGKTGVGPAGTSRGFGGILSTPLTINEITYDRCEEYMATILVSSDADNAPSVTVHTSKSGSLSAKLANIQPYEQSNKITKLDKYLYEIPITSDESFLMVVVTEEKGVSKNTVQSAIHLTSCEGATVISKVPEEKYEEIATSAPKIFDVKFQIESGTQHRSETESEFSYVDNQDLSISAIVDAQTPLQRSELRVITMGQPQEEYIAIKMDIESLPISNSTYVINATIPSSLMQEPAISYWIHIIDENQSVVESKQYNIGVKPISVGDVSFEMDIASIKESGSLVRPQLFVDNNDLPSYGIVSLIVNGEVISKKSQLFATGETVVNLEWKSPNIDEHIIYDVMASVDLYDKSISTQSAKLHIYPKTITMLASDIKSLEPLTEDNTVLADPALIYASNSVDQNLRFHVTAPNGQCIIGVSEECAVHSSTASQRGGLASIEYEDQIIRVRYSGPDSSLERFSITSIDPLVNNWIVSLETSDGIIPQAQAMKDMPIKVKYRTYSETITVSSE